MPEIQATVRQVTLTTSEGIVRDHHVLIDRPTAKAGTDRGMMGGEMLLAALGGCFMSNLLELVRNREANMSDLEVQIGGTLEGTPPHYTAIHLTISGTYEDREQLEKFVMMSERACIVANSIKGSIDLTFTVA